VVETLTTQLTFGRQKAGYGTDSGTGLSRELIWIDTFDPTSLFAGGIQGVYYDPSDASTLFSDSAGTTPAVVNGPVGRISDKSGNGNHLIQATAAARPIYRQGSGLSWLESDGVDDTLQCAAVNLSGFGHLGLAIAVSNPSAANTIPFSHGNVGISTGFSVRLSSGGIGNTEVQVFTDASDALDTNSAAFGNGIKQLITLQDFDITQVLPLLVRCPLGLIALFRLKLFW
jgi:hypothetical protein